MYYSTKLTTPIGKATLASNGERLSGLWLEGQKYFGEPILSDMTPRDDIPIFDQTRIWLNRYFAGECPAVSELPLSPVGSEFRRAVWGLLCEIPYGETVSYGELAKKIAEKQGKTSSSRAVGNAVGHNPISIIIPCHRVIGADGRLTGYAGGIDKKLWLLEHEGVAVK